MTYEEMMQELRTAISPDTESVEVLTSLLNDAASLILNRMYPFGYDGDLIIPARYERIQIQLAVELYTKRGAEGQASHTENGMTRTWPEKSRLLSRIVPYVGSVSDA